MAVKDLLKRFTTSKKDEQIKAFMQKMEVIASNNQWAQMILKQVSGYGGLNSFNYDLVRFIQEGYVQNPNVFSVINKIISPAKSVPWMAYQITDNTEFKRYKSAIMQGNYDRAATLQRKAFEVVENTDLNKFIDNPNALQSFDEYVEAALGYYLLTGNDYHYKFKPSGYKYPTQMYILPAQVIEIVPGDYRRPVKGYRMAFGSSQKEIAAEDVAHRKTFNPSFNFTLDPSDYLYGLSPLAPLCRTVKRSNQSLDASLALLLNGFPPGILSPKDAMEGNAMTKKEKDQVVENWKEQYGGGHKANIPVMSPIPLSWQALGLKSADMELLESDKASLEQIAAVYNVPIPIVSMEAATLDNMKVAEKQLWEKAIIPNLIALRSMLNNSIVADINKAKGVNYWIDFDLQSIAVLQEDKEKLSKILFAGMEHGLYSANEARYKLGDDMIENDPFADKRMLKSGLRYTDEPLQAAKPPKEEENDTN